MLLHNELQYVIAITAPITFLQISNVIAEPFSPKSPNDFSKTPTHYRQKSPNKFSPQSPNTFSPNHRTRFLQSTEYVSSNSPTYFTTRSLQKRRTLYSKSIKRFHRSASSILSFMFSSEKTQSPISPYTCHGLRALRYGWSAAVPWSRPFLLHVHGLRARRYGLRASQGRELIT